MWRENNFSGGTDGVTITTGNSGGTSGDAWSTVAGAPAYEADNATGLRAPMSCLWTSNSDRLRWGGLTFAARRFWIRQYLYFTANPATDEQPLNVNHEGSGITNCALFVTTAGKLALNNTAGSQVGITTNSISLNQWIRYEIQIDIGTTTSNSAFELRLYNSPDSFTVTETVSASGLNFETTLTDRISWVRSANTYQSDSHAVTDTGWPGPSPYGSPTNPKVSFSAVNRAGSW